MSMSNEGVSLKATKTWTQMDLVMMTGFWAKWQITMGKARAITVSFDDIHYRIRKKMRFKNEEDINFYVLLCVSYAILVDK